jgi:hypothetical protein
MKNVFTFLELSDSEIKVGKRLVKEFEAEILKKVTSNDLSMKWGLQIESLEEFKNSLDYKTILLTVAFYYKIEQWIIECKRGKVCSKNFKDIYIINNQFHNLDNLKENFELEGNKVIASIWVEKINSILENIELLDFNQFSDSILMKMFQVELFKKSNSLLNYIILKRPKVFNFYQDINKRKCNDIFNVNKQVLLNMPFKDTLLGAHYLDNYTKNYQDVFETKEIRDNKKYWKYQDFKYWEKILFLNDLLISNIFIVKEDVVSSINSLDSCFQNMKIESLEVEDSYIMLKGKRVKYESLFNIVILSLANDLSSKLNELKIEAPYYKEYLNRRINDSKEIVRKGLLESGFKIQNETHFNFLLWVVKSIIGRIAYGLRNIKLFYFKRKTYGFKNKSSSNSNNRKYKRYTKKIISERVAKENGDLFNITNIINKRDIKRGNEMEKESDYKGFQEVRNLMLNNLKIDQVSKLLKYWNIPLSLWEDIKINNDLSKAIKKESIAFSTMKKVVKF